MIKLMMIRSKSLYHFSQRALPLPLQLPKLVQAIRTEESNKTLNAKELQDKLKKKRWHLDKIVNSNKKTRMAVYGAGSELSSKIIKVRKISSLTPWLAVK